MRPLDSWRWSIFVVYGLSFISVLHGAVPSRSSTPGQEKEPVTFDDYINGALSAKGFGGAWVPGRDVIRMIRGTNVWEYDVESGNNVTIVTEEDFQERFPNQVPSLSFSPNADYILVEHSRRPLWRHSYLAKYDIYNISSKEFTKLQPAEFDGEDDQPELQLVRWAPSQESTSLAFVFQNNLYYKKSPVDNVVQITTDGKEEEIFNGISDWVYEEEMFGSPVAFWFSGDANHLAFVKFNDVNVKTFQWPEYGEPGSRDAVYPNYHPIRYPKSGGNNPETSLHIVSLDDPTNVKAMEYPSGQDPESRYYIATVTWTGDKLILQNLNRAQNAALWQLCTAQNANCDEIYSFQQSNPKGWVSARSPIISQAGDKFLTLQPVKQRNEMTYSHIVSILTDGSETLKEVSSGLINVDYILNWDEENDIIYFQGTGLNDGIPNPSETHVYKISHDDENKTPECISCSLKTNATEECKSNSFSFSSTLKYYIHFCGGPSVPEISTKSLDGTTVYIWEDNESLREKLSTKALPTMEDFEVPIAGTDFNAKVRLYMPPNFDESKKYPLLVDVYAGPGSQRIGQGYGIGWGTYLSSSKDVIYANIDGRGSAKQSLELQFSVYRNLGTYEIMDQIDTVKTLLQNRPYIDSERTAIWGWSYGGYSTAMALGKDTDNVFKCGISVAPVTSWLYYDTIYTERYMGLPSDEDNWINYNESSVMNHVENFRNKKFLLVHGNADDNVHYQQSMMLTKVLEKSDIMFNQLSYPDENHSIGSVRRHLYHSLERFLEHECDFYGGISNKDDPKSGVAAPSLAWSLVLTTVISLLRYY